MKEDKKYYLTDIESGEEYEVSKEQYEGYMKMLDNIMPKGEFKGIGQIMIFGTAGGTNNKGSFEEIFYKV